MSTNSSRRLLAKLSHNASHFVHTAKTWEFKAVGFVEITAILAVDFLQTLFDAGAISSVVGSHFTNQHGGYNSVLVPDIGACQIAIAFLKAKDKPILLMVFLQVENLVTNPLEAGENTAQLYIVMLGNGLGQWGGYQRHNSNRILWHSALFNTASTDIIKEQGAHFVTSYQFIGAVRTLHGNTYPVCIRICSQHQICITFLGQLQARLQSSIDFWIWIAAGGEITIWIFLLWYNGNISNTNIFKYLSNRYQTGAVKWAVYQLQTRGSSQAWAYLTGFNSLIESLLAVIPYKANQAILNALGKGNLLSTIEHINLLDFVVYHIGSLVRHLAAIWAVGLVAIIFGWVVGGCYHNTCITVVVSGGKGQSWYRHSSIVDAYFDAIGSQYTSSGFGENIALKTSVKADGYSLSSALSFYPVGQALSSLSYYIDIHAISTSA